MTSPPSETARRVAWILFASGVTAYLGLSAQALLALGVPYDAPYGPLVAKLHPGTWLITAAYVVLLGSYGHPLRVMAAQSAAHPLLLGHLASSTFLFGYSVLRYGPSGAAFIIETLMMPVVCVFALMLFETRRRHACIVLVLTLLTINALLGITENLLQARLVPLRLAGEAEAAEDIFRPSALLGHPLDNALITCALMPLVLSLRIAMAWRCGLMLLLWMALLAFGGRTSFVLATVGYGACFGWMIFSRLLRGRFSYAQVVGCAFLAMVGVALLGAVIAVSGIGDRILHSMVWDNSASVRWRVWDVFEFVDRDRLVAGSSPDEILRFILRLGLKPPNETIENFWLLMLLQFGLVGFVPYVLGLACAVIWLLQSSRGALRLSVVLFLVAASSNNSLAAKGVELSVLFIAVAATRHRRRVGQGLPVNASTPARPWLVGASSSPSWSN